MRLKKNRNRISKKTLKKSAKNFEKYFLLFTLNLFLISFLSLIDGSLALAENAIKITNVSYASGYDLGSGTTTPIIYGGLTGDGTVGATGCQNSLDATTFCNNCIRGQGVGAETACNTTRIHTELVLHIDFEVVADITGPIYFGYNDGGGVAFASGDYSVSPSTSLSKGDTGYVEITWGKLCTLFLSSQDSSCPPNPGTTDRATLYISLDSNFDTTKRVAIEIQFLDPNATTTSDLLGCATVGLSPTAPDDGICRFNAKPGDEKVFVDDDLTIPNCTVNFKYARFFYSSISQGGSFADAAYGSPNYVDLPFNSSCEPEGDWIIDGLNNGEVYVFRSSMVDLANNNVFLNMYDTPVSGGPEGIFGSENLCTDADLAAVADGPGDQGFDADTACQFAARPGEVVGLLPEDFNCFIATAAYGSSFESKVSTLRKFRNRILFKSKFGKNFIKLYYKYGPFAARYIADKPMLRAITRVALWPFWGFAWFALQYGLSVTLVLIFILIASLLYTTNRAYKINRTKI